MSRGFGTTLGTATTDVIKSALTADSVQRSWFIATFTRARTGTPEYWRHEDTPVTTTAQLYYNGTSLAFARGFSTATGFWTGGVTPSLGVWHTFGVAYDNTATANNPVMFMDTTKLTVTRATAPVGTAKTLNGNIYIGNNSGGSEPTDGMHAEFAVWSVILTDAEFISLAGGCSPLLIRTGSLVEHIPMLRSNVSSKLAAPTITGTAVQPHPRIIKPKPRTMPWIPAETVSV